MSFLLNIESYPTCNWIIWIGAGISYSEPTKLPLGWDLTRFALQETCGDKVQAKIFSLWEQANKIAATSVSETPFGTIPRLESILENIEDVRLKSKNCRFDFMRGFKSFGQAPYNENHLHIANLLLSGATIITTNFDMCINKAYSALVPYDELLLKKDKGIYCYYSKYNLTKARIWNIHGTIEDIPQLGATIRVIKQGLPDDFTKFLDEQFNNTSVLIFLGYSASDSFDVNLYFAHKTKSQFPKSSGLFIQHGSYPAPYNAELVVKCFGNWKIENRDTTNVLRRLSKLSGDVEISKFEWVPRFKDNIDIQDKDKIRNFLICKIANTLGVNTEILDKNIYEKTLMSEQYFEPIDFQKTLAIVCRTKGLSRKEKQHDLKAKQKEEDLLGYYYSKGNFKEALKRAKKLDEMLADISNLTAELDWRTYTSMSVHCRIMVNKYFFNPFIHSISEPDKAKIRSFLEITYILGNQPLKNVKYINQTATALRFYFIFLAMIDNKDSGEIEQKVLSLYAEGASIIGYVSTYRDIAIKKFFLAKFSDYESNFREAKFFAMKSLELASLIGDAHGAKRAKKMLIYFKLYSLLKIIRAVK